MQPTRLPPQTNGIASRAAEILANVFYPFAFWEGCDEIRAFTLIELLIVITIIIVLMGLLISSSFSIAK